MNHHAAAADLKTFRQVLSRQVPHQSKKLCDVLLAWYDKNPRTTQANEKVPFQSSKLQALQGLLCDYRNWWMQGQRYTAPNSDRNSSGNRCLFHPLKGWQEVQVWIEYVLVRNEDGNGQRPIAFMKKKSILAMTILGLCSKVTVIFWEVKDDRFDNLSEERKCSGV